MSLMGKRPSYQLHVSPTKPSLGTNRPRKQVTIVKEATLRTPCSPFCSFPPPSSGVCSHHHYYQELGTKHRTSYTPPNSERPNKKKEVDQNAGACQISPQQHQSNRDPVYRHYSSACTTGTSARPKLTWAPFRGLSLSLFPPHSKIVNETRHTGVLAAKSNAQTLMGKTVKWHGSG